MRTILKEMNIFGMVLLYNVNMKKIIFLLIVFLVSTFSVSAQQKKYITYKVKEGESVRNIAKDFDVKSKEILRLNPGLRKRPATNTVILIPNVNYDPNTIVAISKENHIVHPKETLYGISKLYNVSIESLYATNPALALDGLKIGMVLEIPSEKLLSKEELLQQEIDSWAEHFVLHTVVKDDTYYSLTRFYNVSEESLKTMNPKLSEGLQLGMVIKIKEKVDPIVLDSIASIAFKDSIVWNKPLNIAMVLPFKFTKNDTLTKELLFSTKNNLVNIITDFYLGAEIAIDSLKKQGIPINVSVYDSENNKDTIQQLVTSKAFETTDVVFGPVFSKHVDMLASQLDSIPVIYPFYSSKQKDFKSENIVQTATGRRILKRTVLDYFNDIYTNEHVVIVSDEKIESKKEMIEISEFLKENDSIDKVHYLQPENGYISNERFVAAVDTLGVNWVLLTTNNKVVTADVINNLKALPNNPEVRLFAFEKANNFDKVSNNQLAKMRFVYASSGVLHDSLQPVSDFYEKYQRKNNAFPSTHALRGFDVVYDVLMRMASDESLSLQTTFEKGASKRLRSTFDYNFKMYGSPVYNEAVYLRAYKDDLTIEVIEHEKIEEIKTSEPLIDSENVEDINTIQVKDSLP